MSKPKDEEILVDLWEGIEVEDEAEVEQEEEETEQPEVDEESTEEEDPLADVDLSDDDTEETEEESEGEEPEDEEDVSVVESIKRQLGYEFEQEFEDSEEGIQLLVEEASNKRAEEAINKYFEEYPDVQELLEYRRLGGDPNKFFETRFPDTDYSKVELKQDDESQQEQIIRQELQQVRGYSKEEVDAEIEDYRNGGILESKAKRALSALRVKQQQEQESLVEEQREIERKEQERVKEYWDTVDQTLKEKTELKGFKIPSKDKDEFYSYLSKPVEDGKSQAMINAEKADLETRLAIDFLMFKGFKLSDLVDRKAKDLNAKTLKQRLQKSKLNKQQQKASESDYTEELDTI